MRYKDLHESEDNPRLKPQELRSKAYQFTIDPRNGGDSMRYDSLVRDVGAHNKANPTDQYKVRRWARLGDDNPDAHRYRAGGDLNPRGGFAGPQHVKSEHAQRYDVYVHPHSKSLSDDEYNSMSREQRHDHFFRPRVHWKDRSKG